jgi:hypothetical protein
VKRADYDRYLACFNARDYDGVLQFWAPQFEASFAGVVLRSGAELRRFYAFLHSYVDERIRVDDFVSDDSRVALRALVRIEGRRELTREALAAAGYGGLHPIKAGQVIEIPQLILYRLEGGRFKQVYCALL